MNREIFKITITPERVAKVVTPRGGMTHEIAELLGIWPLKHGWKKRLVGLEVEEEKYDRILELNMRARQKPKETWRDVLKGSGKDAKKETSWNERSYGQGNGYDLRFGSSKKYLKKWDR